MQSSILTEIIDSFSENGFTTKDRIELLRNMQYIIDNTPKALIYEIDEMCDELAGSDLCPYDGEELIDEIQIDGEELDYMGELTHQEFKIKYCPVCGYDSESGD